MSQSKAFGNVAKLRNVVNLQDPLYGAKGDGVTDDYAAIMRAHDNAPDGSTILIKGACRFATPLVFTRRLNWVCERLSDYLKPDLTTLQDALTITGSSVTLPMDLRLNMYGAANCCQYGLVLQNVHYSRIKARVQVGGSAYSFKVAGCLLSEFDLESSVNFTNPLGSPNCAPNHLKIEAYGGIKNNRNEFLVLFEGKDNGIIIADQTNEGNSTFRGVIEGLTGQGIVATACKHMNVRELHMEGVTGTSVFTNCINLSVENVLNYSNGDFQLVSCTGAHINQYGGKLNIDSGSKFCRVGLVRLAAADTFVNNSKTTIIEQNPALESTATRLAGGGSGGGRPSMENFFLNPFCDIWSAGAAAAPDGWSLGSGTFAVETGTVYPGNPRAISVYIASTAVAIANCAIAAPAAPYLNVAEDTFVSVMIPVYIATGQPNLSVYLWDGTTYTELQSVTTKDAWVVVRGSVLFTAGKDVKVVFSPGGAVPSAGNFVVGGLSIVKGTASPQALVESAARREHVVTAVGYTPSFKGQKAYVSGTGKWYLAAGTTNAADWIILN